MKNVLYIILISFLSFTIISCAKKRSDDSSSSGSTEAYKRETMPDTTTVTLPDTLTGEILAVPAELHTLHWINHMGFIRYNMLWV